MVSEVVEKKLYDAASKGDVAILVRLVEEDPYLVHGVSFPFSRNLLHVAAMHGQASIVEEVLKFNPRLARISDSQKSSPLHIAAEEGHVEICQRLLSVAPEACWWRDCHDMNPLHIAAMKGHVEIVKRLLQESHLLVMERLHRKETVLHLCVKHGQLRTLKVLVDRLGEDLVDAFDEDGETILHLAVRANQLETVRYLVESKKIKRRARNSTGKTPLQILNESPRYTSSSYSEIRRSLLKLLQPSLESAMPEMTNTTMVVVVLITTMAFQNAVNPPGGMWQEDTSSHKAGEAVIAYTHPHIYKHLVRANIVAFVSSILTIFLIASGLTSRNIFLLNIALFGMWVSLIAIAVSYGASTMVITPNTKTKSVDLIVVIISLISLISFLVALLFVHIAMMYFSWRGKIRGREDLTTDPLPKRILYRIFQRLETWGCLRPNHL